LYLSNAVSRITAIPSSPIPSWGARTALLLLICQLNIVMEIAIECMPTPRLDSISSKLRSMATYAMSGLAIWLGPRQKKKTETESLDYIQSFSG
jgi:hypothetical protein